MTEIDTSEIPSPKSLRQIWDTLEQCTNPKDYGERQLVNLFAIKPFLFDIDYSHATQFPKLQSFFERLLALIDDIGPQNYKEVERWSKRIFSEGQTFIINKLLEYNITREIFLVAYLEIPGTSLNDFEDKGL